MEKINSKIKIPINAKVLYEIQQYAAYAKFHYKSEIAGWGHYNEENGIYKLAPLVKQTVTGCTADTISDVITKDIKYDISDLIVFWHSHVDMSPTPSKTDLDQIEEFLQPLPMVITIIVNCNNQYSARLSMSKSGGRFSVALPSPVYYDVELEPYYEDAKVSKEVEKKLKIEPVTAPVPTSGTPKFGIYEGGAGYFANEAYIKGNIRQMGESSYTPPTTQEQERDVAILEVLQELEKLKDVIKTIYTPHEPNSRGYVLQSKLSNGTIRIVYDYTKQTFKTYFLGKEEKPEIAIESFLEMLKANEAISSEEYIRIQLLLGNIS